jgi:hypothetical protein
VIICGECGGIFTGTNNMAPVRHLGICEYCQEKKEDVMKWTPDTVSAVNWKEKSTYETLCACVEHWDEICQEVMNRRYASESTLHLSSSCPACKKWHGATAVRACDGCPLVTTSCCDNRWGNFSFDHSYTNACAVRAFIISKRDEYRGCKPIAPVKVEPEYEWVDCTKEFVPDAKMVNYGLGGIYYYVVVREGTVYLCPTDQMMLTLGKGYKLTTSLNVFRIERRVEKKIVPPAFKLCDKVRYEDKTWIVAKLDSCKPPCATLERTSFDRVVTSITRLEAIK